MGCCGRGALLSRHRVGRRPPDCGPRHGRAAPQRAPLPVLHSLDGRGSQTQTGSRLMVSTRRSAATPLTDPGDFSIVLGGPLFQLLRRAHLSGNALELQVQRVLAMTAVSWLPLLILSA